MSELTSTQVEYLAIIEHRPFAPDGWLYRGIYVEMARLGLCCERPNGFAITAWGRDALANYRGGFE